MTRAVLETILRYIISPLVAYAAGKGWVDAGASTELVAGLVALGVGIHGVIATIRNKRAAEKNETTVKVETPHR